LNWAAQFKIFFEYVYLMYSIGESSFRPLGKSKLSTRESSVIELRIFEVKVL